MNLTWYWSKLSWTWRRIAVKYWIEASLGGHQTEGCDYLTADWSHRSNVLCLHYPRPGAAVIMSGTAAWARRGWRGGSCSCAAQTGSCCTIRLRGSYLEAQSSLQGTVGHIAQRHIYPTFLLYMCSFTVGLKCFTLGLRNVAQCLCTSLE